MASKSSKTIVWIIVGLLVVGLFGFGTVNFSGSVGSVAKVGETDVTVTRYVSDLRRQVAQMQAQTGQQISVSDAIAFGMDRAVLSRLIGTAALENEASDLGLSVSDDLVGAEIFKTDAFQDTNGNFDRATYESLLSRNNLSVKEYENTIRADLSQKVLSTAVIAGTKMPGSAARAILDWAGERRDLSWAPLDASLLETPLPEPSEAELQTQYEATPAAYTIPETRAITYAWLTPEMLAGSVEIDDDLLRQAYEQQADSYRQPERRLVERLVFPDEAAATAAKAAIDAGETSFDDLVAERGLSLTDVDLGDVTQAELGAAGDAVFALDGPGVAGPAPSGLGPALFRMNAILAAQETSFEEARDELAEEQKISRAQRMIEDMYSDVQDQLAGGATLEDLAGSTAMELGQIGWRPDVEDGIAAYPAFRAAARSVSASDFPQLDALSDGGIFAIRLDEIRAPELQPLEAVRDQVAADWEAAETLRRLQAEASGLAAELEAGGGWEATGLEPRAETGLVRNAFLDDAPQGLVAAAFEMEPGDVRVISDASGVALLTLDAVNPAEADDATLQAIETQLSQSLAQDLIAAFAAAARDQAGVTIDQATLSGINAQLQ